MPESASDELLAEALQAIANATRLRVLRSLQVPRTLHEIEVPIQADDHDRNIARQTVRAHLDKLLGAGLVTVRPSERSARNAPEYSLNHQALFTLVEDLREVARLRGLVEPAGATMPGQAAARPVETGPLLLLVKGVEEGRVFPLHERDAWLIGRRRGADVPLDYDPFVSSENTLIRRAAGAFTVEDLPVSRNGTSLNLRPLERGVPHPLRHGDLVGVGRSLLLFRE